MDREYSNGKGKVVTKTNAQQGVCCYAGKRLYAQLHIAISPYPADGNSVSFCCYLHHQFFNRLRLRAGPYKIPAQQQALAVCSKTSGLPQTMNYFQPKTAAERYSKGRPDFHSNTIKHIKDYLGLDKKLNDVLDIACGTGLSTKALLEIAINVYGTDTSQEMLNFASEPDKIHYSIASAEQQPFPDSSFDLITVSSGVHWFNIDKFLIEANRLLKNKAWLVLYENHFISEMIGNENFTNWFPNIYLKKFPSPPRNNTYDWTNENLNSKNLNFVTEEKFKNSVTLTKKQLALYFTTQSNIIAAVEKNQTTYEQVENWLDQELASFFDNNDTTRTINYGNWIKYIQRLN